MDIYEQIEKILEFNIATGKEIDLVLQIVPDNQTALNDIIWVRTGYRSLEDYIEYEVAF